MLWGAAHADASCNGGFTIRRLPSPARMRHKRLRLFNPAALSCSDGTRCVLYAATNTRRPQRALVNQTAATTVVNF